MKEYPAKVETGQRFGMLTVVAEIKSAKHSRRVLCKCDCGNVHVHALSALRAGNAKSCGCYRRQITGNAHRKHGETGTRLYHIWKHIHSRCLNKNRPDYMHYGGKGIKVCPEWDDFIAFRDWSLLSGYADNLTIERKDNAGDYCPANCTWITQADQARHTGRVILITYNGETRNLSEWSRVLNIPYSTLLARTKHMPIQDAFTLPLKSKAQVIRLVADKDTPTLTIEIEKED